GESIYGYRCYMPYKSYCALRITGKIDDYVMDLLKAKIKKLNLNVKKGLEKIKTKKNNTDYYRKDLEKIEGKISRLTDGYVNGLIPIEEFKKRNEELKNAKTMLQKEIKKQTT
ncbi:MAG: hypothetical protein M1308_23635, partial [Actinobacteria bacterium]|nr:hypothetical protein [Actinomycetota bacterium]